MALPIPITHDNLGFHKVSTRWLREFKVDYKQRSLGICQQLLNAHSHVSIKTIEAIGQLGSEVLQHSAYSSELVPSNYHFFSTLKVVW